jgi:16S rRNA (uracil1498-N3)-methyltransferase
MENKKKRHWFHTKEDLGKEEITLTEKELVHQLVRVLKFHLGDEIVLADGKGTVAISRIEELESETVRVSVINTETREPKNKKISLYFAIPKKSKFEIILEKGTEIGISAFYPIITARTEKLDIKTERGEKIIKEATEQSERYYLPELYEPTKINEILKNLNKSQTFVFHTNGENFTPSVIPAQAGTQGEVNVLIGPEGGWSNEEIEEFKNLGFQIFKAGDGILKTETAAIVLSSLFIY